jgi:ATP-dependent Clp protease protease subunit
MIHQPWGGVQGTAEDISRQTNEILRLRQKVNEIMSFHTGKTIEQILKDTDRDYFMSAEEAKDYGLVDEVIISARDKK